MNNALGSILVISFLLGLFLLIAFTPRNGGSE